MKNNERWAVYYRLDRSSIYSVGSIPAAREFETVVEAEAFLDTPANEITGTAPPGDFGWRGPIPIVDFAPTGPLAYNGPWLSDRLKFADATDKKTATLDEAIDIVWQDDAVDQVPDVMAELEKQGLTPPENPLARTGEARAYHAAISQRLRVHVLPEIECYLSPNWDFRNMESDARRRLAHINPNGSEPFKVRILAAAVDLETALRRRHPYLTSQDVRNFWTSWQVHVHIASFCQKKLWDQRFNDMDVEQAREDFCRALGSYAHEICPALPDVATVSGIYPVIDKETSAASQLRGRESAPALGSEGSSDSPRTLKGDVTLIAGKRAVTFRTAEQYLGISERQRQYLIKSGTLTVEGKGQNRKITTASLKDYLKPENPK